MNRLQQVWDKVWAEKDIEKAVNDVHKNSGDPHVRTHFPFVQRILNDLRRDSLVLEAGCGTGEWVFYAEKLQNWCVGIDLAKNTLRLVQKCATKRRSNVTFILGDIRNLPFKKNTLDCILCLGVIEHFSVPKPLLIELFRILKPYGKVLITTPNVYCSHTITRPLLKLLGKWNLGHEDSYSPKKLRNIIEEFGFKGESEGVMLGGDIFGTAPKYIPLVGHSLHYFLAKLSQWIEKKTNLFGFWSYVVATKLPKEL